jgi:hypothetical protein
LFLRHEFVSMGAARLGGETWRRWSKRVLMLRKKYGPLKGERWRSSTSVGPRRCARRSSQVGTGWNVSNR